MTNDPPNEVENFLSPEITGGYDAEVGETFLSLLRVPTMVCRHPELSGGLGPVGCSEHALFRVSFSR